MDDFLSLMDECQADINKGTPFIATTAEDDAKNTDSKQDLENEYNTADDDDHFSSYHEDVNPPIVQKSDLEQRIEDLLASLLDASDRSTSQKSTIELEAPLSREKEALEELLLLSTTEALASDLMRKQGAVEIFLKIIKIVTSMDVEVFSTDTETTLEMITALVAHCGGGASRGAQAPHYPNKTYSQSSLDPSNMHLSKRS